MSWHWKAASRLAALLSDGCGEPHQLPNPSNPLKAHSARITRNRFAPPIIVIPQHTPPKRICLQTTCDRRAQTHGENRNPNRAQRLRVVSR